MAIPQSRDELLSAIDVRFSRLHEDLLSVPLARADVASMPGHKKGTVMSARDLVAYLIGWNCLVLRWLEDDRASVEIEFPEVGFKWSELGELAQKFYRDHDEPFDELVFQLVGAKDAIVYEVEGFSNVRLYGQPWCKAYTMGRMIQLNTSSPYANARGRLRRWFRDEGVG